MGNCVGGKGKKDPTILSEEEVKLLLENTKLNRAQINALHQNFLKECPSCKLTKKDFIKLFKEVHPSENKKEKADKFCEYVFKVIDRESLGYISFNDFVLCFSLTSYGDFKQKCEFAFRLYDLDKDNLISKKEMTQVLVALYDLSGITDRKKDKAPAKKVDEIMKLINAKTEAAAAAEQGPEDQKNKKNKKSKKANNTINRDQFIDACSNDEALKKLFVDSIFAANGAEPVLEVVDITPTPVAIACDFGGKFNKYDLDAPAIEVTTSSNVECAVFKSIDTPEVGAEQAKEETKEAAAEPSKEEPAKEEPAKEEPAKEEPAKDEPSKEEKKEDKPLFSVNIGTKSDAEQKLEAAVTEAEVVPVIETKVEASQVETIVVSSSKEEEKITSDAPIVEVTTTTITKTTEMHQEGDNAPVTITKTSENVDVTLSTQEDAKKVVEEIANLIDRINEKTEKTDSTPAVDHQ